jgi:hypothetical protein
MRHQQLFDILANVRMPRYYDTELDAWCVPDFTLKLSWNPEDVLLGAVPFRISYRSSDEISAAMDKLPEKKEMDLYEGTIRNDTIATPTTSAKPHQLLTSRSKNNLTTFNLIRKGSLANHSVTDSQRQATKKSSATHYMYHYIPGNPPPKSTLND